MTRRTVYILLFSLLCATFAVGQAHRDTTTETQTILLWENGAPGALGQAEEDKPTLTVYRPWFNSIGVTTFLLRYRLGPRYHHPIELGDAERAIRLVRGRAAEFGVSTDRIGIMGFSAGGHLASRRRLTSIAESPRHRTRSIAPAAGRTLRFSVIPLFLM